MTGQPVELHARDHDAFLAEVHSFEFWFRAVQEYLKTQDEAERPAEPERSEAELQALIATLSTYCVGETAALEGASGMIGFAPNHNAKIFLATQVADEARHLEVFLRRLSELGVTDPVVEIEKNAHPSLLAFKKRLLHFVEARDWEAAVLAQNVILESMEFATFRAHLQNTDERTAALLSGVIKDERRHMGFGENDLGRRLAASPHARTRLEQIKRELDPLVLATFDEVLDEMKVPRDQRPDLGKSYLEMVGRLGFPA